MHLLSYILKPASEEGLKGFALPISFYIQTFMVKNVQKLLCCLSGGSDNLHSAADFLYCAFRPVVKAYLI